MIAIMWEFTIKEGQHAEFETFYGAEGEWTKVNRHTRSYLGTSFLRDQSESARYIVIEYWSEMLVAEEHKKYRSDELERLEQHRATLVDQVAPMGIFTALDVPDRFGPTWSRRA